jgi:hypothetical protein
VSKPSHPQVPAPATTLTLSVLLALSLAVSQAGARGERQPLTRSPHFKATLTAPTHRPKATTKWYYTIRVSDLHGKPIRARITVQIKDPLGSLHPVQYANTKKNLVNWPINGRFRDYIIWPRSSAIGISLTRRVTVNAAGGKTVLSYLVRPTA